MKKNKGLGRGLGALLKSAAPATEQLQHIPVKQVDCGQYQPRTQVEAQALDALAQSIRQQGVIQPILVRRSTAGRYEIIAGERRWRAAQMAGLLEIPALVRDISDQNTAIAALIENIQREDLNPLEEAAGLHRLIAEFGMTHESAAQAVGKSRSSVSNLLRLLSLAEPVRALLLQRQLEMGHARALLTLPEHGQIELANTVIKKRLSVRETERLAQLSTQPTATAIQKVTNEFAEQETALSQRLNAKVSIRHTKKGGCITIECADIAVLLQRLSSS